MLKFRLLSLALVICVITSVAFIPTASASDSLVDRFSPTGGMASPRISHSATLLFDGRVLVTGGFDGSNPPRCCVMASAELYNPATGRWSSAAGMAVDRRDHTATLLPDGKVLVTGGVAWSPQQNCTTLLQVLGRSLEE